MGLLRKISSLMYIYKFSEAEFFASHLWKMKLCRDLWEIFPRKTRIILSTQLSRYILENLSCIWLVNDWLYNCSSLGDYWYYYTFFFLAFPSLQQVDCEANDSDCGTSGYVNNNHVTFSNGDNPALISGQWLSSCLTTKGLCPLASLNQVQRCFTHFLFWSYISI